jgi:hypothetical protein
MRSLGGRLSILEHRFGEADAARQLRTVVDAIYGDQAAAVRVERMHAAGRSLQISSTPWQREPSNVPHHETAPWGMQLSEVGGGGCHILWFRP